ncbi:Zinc finger, C2H2-like protein [Cordyceps fumosorosea ARSEF 2679]|uniref:Zinc finger, C2H2-like protein n=1 Tax=Cordyceps fumosorosea (strain ARSEF 2679) TaxID=1081104 RepID=A0A162JHP3_CORFA|nr:Zinc finger, C2H2-like protein [Cordyceps fumosorosea ARSEF 2679]OAA69142.1 Zinc finger, C2H2-like protein [Cordyceps fumosorosea ARSEF 2679]
MGKKRRGHPDVEELLARPWCYYCERDFEDLKLLISHQKAKHFKCERCGRRLNTAGGLSVHMNQVHKETVNQVENALPNRQGLEVEIFGMEGVPQEVLEQHRTRIIQNFYQAQESRRIATGNPLPGQSLSGGAGARKKIQYETAAALLQRLAEWRAHKKAGTLPPQVADGAGVAANNQPGYAEGLPQRHAASAAFGDELDQLIRSAEQPERTVVKKEKDGKKSRLVYDDPEVSPEERMAQLPRYAYQPTVAA